MILIRFEHFNYCNIMLRCTFCNWICNQNFFFYHFVSIQLIRYYRSPHLGRYYTYLILTTLIEVDLIKNVLLFENLRTCKRKYTSMFIKIFNWKMGIIWLKHNGILYLLNTYIYCNKKIHEKVILSGKKKIIIQKTITVQLV